MRDRFFLILIAALFVVVWIVPVYAAENDFYFQPPEGQTWILVEGSHEKEFLSGDGSKYFESNCYQTHDDKTRMLILFYVYYGKKYRIWEMIVSSINNKQKHIFYLKNNNKYFSENNEILLYKIHKDKGIIEFKFEEQQRFLPF